jgi:hypothetical protein
MNTDKEVGGAVHSYRGTHEWSAKDLERFANSLGKSVFIRADPWFLIAQLRINSASQTLMGLTFSAC